MTALERPGPEQPPQMTDDQIVDLLTVISSYDKRVPDAAAVIGWSESARRARWTYAEALEAVHEHFAFSPDYLKQAHLTALIAQARQASGGRRDSMTVREALPAPLRPPAEPERVRGLVDQVANLLGWERTAKRGPVVSPVECPACHAMPDKPCVRKQHRGPHKGRYVPLSKPHPSRLELERNALP